MAGTVRVSRITLGAGKVASTASVRVSRITLQAGKLVHVGSIRVSRVTLQAGQSSTYEWVWDGTRWWPILAEAVYSGSAWVTL